jgi:hypothetical protein
MSGVNENSRVILESLDWNKISIAWNDYKENPSEINASILLEFFPKNIIISADEINVHRPILDNIYNNLDILERRILNGSNMSVEIGLRLFAVADGAFAEELSIIMGLYLNKNIEQFLEIISCYPLLIEPLLESFLVSVRPEFLGDVVAVIRELEYRRNILRSVQKQSLQSLKNKCLCLIDKNLKELKEFSK